MKLRKIILVELLIILSFSIIVQGFDTFSNEQDDEVNTNIVPPTSASSSVEIEWNQTWGGSDWDLSTEVAVDSSGDVYLVGNTRSFGAGLSDMVLVKYNSNGTQQWNCTWGGSEWDAGEGVAVDSSNNVYLSGGTPSFGAGLSDMVLVKYDSSGVQQWNRTWGGSEDDSGMGVAVDSSDNVYLTGGTNSFGAGSLDMVLVKYDSSGVQQWNRTWSGSEDESGFVMAIDSSDNVYIAGYTFSFGEGSRDMVLVKYDSSGVQQWNRTEGGIGYDSGTGVAVDSFDNVYLAGAISSFMGDNRDMVLVKYDSSGVRQWNQTWGGSEDDSGEGVAVDSLDNVYLAGATYYFWAGKEIALVKYDNSGVQQWNRTWGGSEDDTCMGVAVDASDNVYLAGSTYSFGAGDMDMVLVKFDVAEDKEEEANPQISGYNFIWIFGLCGIMYMSWIIRKRISKSEKA